MEQWRTQLHSKNVKFGGRKKEQTSLRPAWSNAKDHLTPALGCRKSLVGCCPESEMRC